MVDVNALILRKNDRILNNRYLLIGSRKLIYNLAQELIKEEALFVRHKKCRYLLTGFKQTKVISALTNHRSTVITVFFSRVDHFK